MHLCWGQKQTATQDSNLWWNTKNQLWIKYQRGSDMRYIGIPTQCTLFISLVYSLIEFCTSWHRVYWDNKQHSPHLLKVWCLCYANQTEDDVMITITINTPTSIYEYWARSAQSTDWLLFRCKVLLRVTWATLHTPHAPQMLLHYLEKN